MKCEQCKQDTLIDEAIELVDVALGDALRDAEAQGGDRFTVATAVAAWMVSNLRRAQISFH